MGERKVVIREMIEDEPYVDYNRKPLELLGCQFVRLEVAGVTVSKTRVLVDPISGKSIVGCDWLVAIRYKITQPIERNECKVSTKIVYCNKVIGEISPEIMQLEGEFQKLFK